MLSIALPISTATHSTLPCKVCDSFTRTPYAQTLARCLGSAGLMAQI